MEGGSVMKHSILFVDDDVHLLDGLKRLLRGQRDRWEMSFAGHPRQALDLLAVQTFDVVVSDMRMPDIDGTMLLAHVEKIQPAALRVILSGYAEEKSIFRSVGPAHQYIAKPCAPETIIALMDRAFRLRDVLAQPRLRRMAAGLRTLPSPPSLYLKLTAEMQKEEISTKAVVALIAEDPAMTAELLKITNSSYFSLAARVTTVTQAVNLLGMETICALVLTSGIFKQYEGKPKIAAMVEALNHYALALGTITRRLSKQDGATEAAQGDAYCAAMLACVGSLILLDSEPDRFEDAMKEAGHIGLEAAEQAAFGGSHPEIGAYLLGLWGFPDPLIEAVFYQLRPSDSADTGKTPLTFVHLARVFGPPYPLVVPDGAGAARLDTAYVKRIGLAEPVSIPVSHSSQT